MKTAPVLEPPKKQTHNPVTNEPESVIDTSKMSKGQREALELTEAARERTRKSFAGDIFMGKFSLNNIYPFPEQSEQDIASGASFLSNLENLLRSRVDPDAIDEDGEIPELVFDQLAEIGAFGIKIPKAYSGLGLSQVNYSRAAILLGSYCGNLTALLSAHQSIGVPQPLIVFGTDEQKKKYLPRFSKGEVSAFALTEHEVGSDPAKMKTTADPSEDGQSYIINGEKLWCTNGTRATVIVVMARTPDKIIRGKKRNQITAFIVDMDTPGVKVTHRCHFMGLKALYNGVIEFKNVKVSSENIILAEGKGLKVALTTLNTGRITLPAACIGLAKRCLNINRQWASERVQWGAPIGKHAAIAEKISRIAADIFTMESIVLLTSALVDRKKDDIRIESSMCKMWGTETGWRIVDETMQIRGGRGYETAASLKARGDNPIPVERLMRDSRINLIFEGSSEIMRLFIAREALDPHLNVAGGVLNSKFSLVRRLKDAFKAGIFYATWYPRLWIPINNVRLKDLEPSLRPGLKYVSATSRKLARTLFHAMVRNGPKLEKKQPLLGRIVNIGTELFVITAASLRADTLLKKSTNQAEQKELNKLVTFIVKDSQLKIKRQFNDLKNHNDHLGYNLAQDILEDRYTWLEDGIVL